jgi:hypothetical protein
MRSLAITGLHWLHVAVEDMEITQIEEARGMACAQLCECYQLGIGTEVDEIKAAGYRTQAYKLGATERGALPGAFVTVETADWDVPGGVLTQRFQVAESGQVIEVPKDESLAIAPVLDRAEATRQLELWASSKKPADKDTHLRLAALHGSATADFMLGDAIWNKHEESYLKLLEMADDKQAMGAKQVKTMASGLLVMTRALQHLRRALHRGWADKDKATEDAMVLSASQRVGLFHKNHYPTLPERSFERRDHEAFAMVYLGRASTLGCEASSMNLANMLEARGDIAGALTLYRQCPSEEIARNRVTFLELLQGGGGSRTDRLLAGLPPAQRAAAAVPALPDRSGETAVEQKMQALTVARSCASSACETQKSRGAKLLVCCKEAHYCSAR